MDSNHKYKPGDILGWCDYCNKKFIPTKFYKINRIFTQNSYLFYNITDCVRKDSFNMAVSTLDLYHNMGLKIVTKEQILWFELLYGVHTK